MEYLKVVDLKKMIENTGDSETFFHLLLDFMAQYKMASDPGLSQSVTYTDHGSWTFVPGEYPPVEQQ